MIRGAPCQFIIKNGKLEPRVQNPTKNTENFRVITYEHTVRNFPDDYMTATIKQYKKELQELKKDYGQLQRAYWHLLGAAANGLTPDSQTLKKSYDHLKSMNISISEFNPLQGVESLSENLFSLGGIFTQLEQTKQKLKKLTESNVTCLTQSLNNATQTSIIDNEESEVEEQQQSEFHYKLLCALEQIHALKQQLEETTNNHVEVKELQDQNQQLEKTIKKLEEILEREKKNNRMLNQMICRMRNDINSKETLVKEIISLKKFDRSTIQNLVKKHGIKTN